MQRLARGIRSSVGELALPFRPLYNSVSLLFNTASHTPSFIVIVRCYKSSGSILNFFRARLEDLHPRGPKQNRCIAGLGVPVLCMLPLLPLVDKRLEFASGSEGSDLPWCKYC